MVFMSKSVNPIKGPIGCPSSERISIRLGLNRGSVALREINYKGKEGGGGRQLAHT